jgi:acetylglutamate kinase
MDRTEIRDVVLKVGGHELLPGPGLLRLTRLVRSLRRIGHRVLLVHGGGEEVTHRADALGLSTTRSRGQRITSAPMLEIVLEVLVGRVNSRLVAALLAAEVPAIGFSMASAGILSVRLGGTPPGCLGFVGVPERLRTSLLQVLLAEGMTPVLAPIGTDRAGQLYNVNADLAAGALSAALGAHLWMLTDVPGVRGPTGATLSSLSGARARLLLARGVANEGMIPKLEAAEHALRAGAHSVWVGALHQLSSRGPRLGQGTWVTRDRRAPRTVRLLPSLSAASGSHR